MSNGDFVVLEEAERQFEHLQALKKLDFLTTKNFKSYDEDDGGAESTIASTRSKTKEPTASASAFNHDDLSLGEEYSSAFQSDLLFWYIIDWFFFSQDLIIINNRRRVDGYGRNACGFESERCGDEENRQIGDTF